MNELSLFSGAGGGLLGTKLLGFRCVSYVENNAYCQEILKARIRDGLLDPAPIFGDIREFLRSSDCDRFAGRVDVVTAGFPCQPFSVAGKRAGADDSRNLWPETAAVLGIVRPRFALLENVPGLLSSGYFGRVLEDLAALGFDAEWTVLGADDVGAPHRRKRLWILAYAAWHGGPESETSRPDRERVGASGDEARMAHAAEQRPQERSNDLGLWELETIERGGSQVALPDAERDELRIKRERRGQQRSEPRQTEPRDDGEEGSLADSDRRRREGERGGGLLDGERTAFGNDADGRGSSMADPALELPHRTRDSGPNWRTEHSGRNSWWLHDPADEGPESESFVGRVAHGVAYRMDRLRALGNGQVPAVVVRAWEELSREARRS